MAEQPRVRLIYESETKRVYSLGPVTVRIGRDRVWLCLTCGYGKNLDCRHVAEVRAWVDEQEHEQRKAS